MAITYRSVKGSPLTSDEMDENFETLEDGKVNNTGNETIAGVKTFSSDPIIPDEVYGAGWDGSLEPPTKNAVYDKIETVVTSVTAAISDVAYDSSWNEVTTVAPSKNAVYDKIELLDAAKLNLSGGTMSGPLNMGTNDITDVGSIATVTGATILSAGDLTIGGPGSGVIGFDTQLDITSPIIQISTDNGVLGEAWIYGDGVGSGLSLGYANSNIEFQPAGSILVTANSGSVNISGDSGVEIGDVGSDTNLEGDNLYLLVDGGYTKGWQELTQTYSALGFGANQFYADGSGMQIQVDTGSTVIVNNDSDIDITATSGNVDITASGAISFIQGTDTFILPSKSGAGGTVAMINNETFTGDTTFSDLTASRATYLDASKVLKTSVVTQAELELLSGYTEHEFIQLKKVVITISEAEMLALNGTPLDAIAAVSGKVISLIDVVGRYNYNTAAYSGNAITLKYDGGADIASFNASFTTATASEREKATINGSIKVLENTKVQIYVPSANPTTGDGDYEIAIIYREEDFV